MSGSVRLKICTYRHASCHTFVRSVGDPASSILECRLLLIWLYLQYSLAWAIEDFCKVRGYSWGIRPTWLGRTRFVVHWIPRFELEMNSNLIWIIKVEFKNCRRILRTYCGLGGSNQLCAKFTNPTGTLTVITKLICNIWPQSYLSTLGMPCAVIYTYVLLI